jgi:hydroxymethylpyrimidine/phosphomethylpyrimidine kinase
VPVVIDPVLQSSTGTALTNGTHLLSAYSEAFWGLNTLFTPNIPEAESLLKIAPIQTLAAAQTAAVKLTTYFPNILLKGGHLPTTEPLTDTLMVDGEYYMFPHERIEAGALHGTGCTLASAIVAHWANGLPLPDAVAAAQSYIRQAILTAPKGVGQGRRVLNHFPQTNLSTQIKQ